MVTRCIVLSLATALMAGTSWAQQTRPAAKPAVEAPPAPRPPAGAAQPVNIKLDFTITDQSGAGPAGKRSVSMLVRDRSAGSVRSGGNVQLEGKGRFSATLNVDAEPTILEPDKIRLRVSLEYLPKPDQENAVSGEGRGNLRQSLNVIVEPGKPITISQASDPTSDRKITVDLTATILK
jgi:hypothetical protein